MKSEAEIKDRIKIYKQIQIEASIFTSEFTLASGAITALEWVLEPSTFGSNKTLN